MLKMVILVVDVTITIGKIQFLHNFYEKGDESSHEITRITLKNMFFAFVIYKVGMFSSPLRF